MAEILSTKSNEELNELYMAGQYLSMDGLKKSIAAFLACKVYHGKTLKEYAARKSFLGIKN